MSCSIIARAIRNVHNKVDKFDSFFNDHPWLRKAFITVGAVYLLNRFLSRPQQRLFAFDIAERYGKGSWAVVTGASDGIGKAFVIELAKHGFNVVLVARSVDKMDAICQEVQDKYKVQTKIVQADFTQGDRVDFYEKLAKEVEGFDVSILVNNVGISNSKRLLDTSDKEVHNMLIVNAASTVFTTKTLFNQLLNRPQKSAVITISSILGHFPVPYAALYSATKSFQDYFSHSLIPEYGHKIDFISLQPATVTTNMMPQKSPFSITPQEFVQAGLRELSLGKTQSFGHSIHKRIISKAWVGCGKVAKQTRIRNGQYLRDLEKSIKQEEKK